MNFSHSTTKTNTSTTTTTTTTSSTTSTPTTTSTAITTTTTLPPLQQTQQLPPLQQLQQLQQIQRKQLQQPQPPQSKTLHLHYTCFHYNYHSNHNYIATTLTTTLRCLQPLVGASVGSLCDPPFTATNLLSVSYFRDFRHRLVRYIRAIVFTQFFRCCKMSFLYATGTKTH